LNFVVITLKVLTDRMQILTLVAYISKLNFIIKVWIWIWRCVFTYLYLCHEIGFIWLLIYFSYLESHWLLQWILSALGKASPALIANMAGICKINSINSNTHIFAD